MISMHSLAVKVYQRQSKAIKEKKTSMKKILITGGTGFIGKPLCAELLKKSYKLTVVSRQPNKVPAPIKGIKSFSEIAATESFDVVINLAGEPIADKRWTKIQKQKIIESRIQTTQSLIEFIRTRERPPEVIISGSAIGYYGVGYYRVGNAVVDNIADDNAVDANLSVEDSDIDESGTPDQSFSSQLCQAWENTVKELDDKRIRICFLRIGIVLEKNGGVLKKMLTPFSLGLGGKMGNGKQWMPWIHRDDLIAIIERAIDDDTFVGPINCTAPNPVTNDAFTEHLSHQLNRPAFFHLPSPFVRLLMGQMGEELLLSGKRVIPKALLDNGYRFKYSQLSSALSAIFD